MGVIEMMAMINVIYQQYAYLKLQCILCHWYTDSWKMITLQFEPRIMECKEVQSALYDSFLRNRYEDILVY